MDWPCCGIKLLFWNYYLICNGKPKIHSKNFIVERVGLSKINRIVKYYAERPQVQERLTIQIVRDLQKVLNTDDVACVIDAKHLCVNSRGIKDINSSTVTSEFGGKFKKDKFKREFLDYLKLESEL